ncbi:hypothetical protein GCM10022210_16110 [Mucilaginibacter dorajii]|uniref:Uncharacterized protein n=1 Tax=Mucilaginibacter dorajii TaxID=692994 RepID=A0ABP7PME9_9SPHI
MRGRAVAGHGSFINESFSVSRRQNSFGRKRAKQYGAVRWQGIGVFAAGGNVSEGKIIPAQVLSVLQGKGPCGKEAFLPT